MSLEGIHLSGSIDLSVLPDYGLGVASCLMLLPPRYPAMSLLKPTARINVFSTLVVSVSYLAGAMTIVISAMKWYPEVGMLMHRPLHAS